MLFWTNPGSSTLQNCNCSATYLPSHIHAGFWRAKDKLISNILPWTSTHRLSVDCPAKTYIYLLCADTGCCLVDLPWWMIRESQRDSRCWHILMIIMMMLFIGHYSCNIVFHQHLPNLNDTSSFKLPHHVNNIRTQLIHSILHYFQGSTPTIMIIVIDLVCFGFMTYQPLLVI